MRSKKARKRSPGASVHATQDESFSQTKKSYYQKYSEPERQKELSRLRGEKYRNKRRAEGLPARKTNNKKKRNLQPQP
jgi:hypothetical protein